MIILIGLGNYPKEYSYTRHNFGSRFIDFCYDQAETKTSWNENTIIKYSEIIIKEKKVLLIISKTYMNESGKIYSFFKQLNYKPEELFCAYDDVETNFEKIKIKKNPDRSPKGHNGLRSIKEYFGFLPYLISLGVSRPDGEDHFERGSTQRAGLMDKHVLGKFSREQEDKIPFIFQSALELFLKNI